MATRVNVLCAAARVKVVPWHVPGSKRVEEGIAGASRDGTHFGARANAQALQEPAVSDVLWELVCYMAARVRNQMTVDRFPSAVNRLLICACRASIAGSRSLTRNPQTHWLSWTGSDPFAPPAGWYTGRLTTSVRRDRWSERH